MPAKSKRQESKAAKQQAIEEENMYEIGDIIAIYQEDQLDNFTFAVIKEAVKSDKDKILAHLALRVDKQPNIFYTCEDLEVEVLHSDVIAAITDAKKAAIKTLIVSDASSGTHNSTEKISVTAKSYSITKTIASNFVPAPIEESEEEDEEEEAEEEKSKSKSRSKSAKKIKKIIGSKKSDASKAATQGRRTKKGDGSNSKSQNPAEKFKKTSDGKVQVEKFVKGKFNPAITIREKMEQKANTSETANLEQSVSNNTRELIRAATIGSLKLYKSVAYSKEKIHTLNPKWGVECEQTPLRIAMINKDTKMVEAILKSLDSSDKANENLSFANLPAPSINRVETGFNDKYAYGVATRMVQMSRGNKEGNNAFTHDSRNRAQQKSLDYGEIDWMMSNNHISLSEIEQVLSYNPEMRHQFLSAIQKSILAGNAEKAEYFIAENLKKDDYTFNKFHKLALSAKNVAQLEDIKKKNMTKQAVGVGNYSPIMCACINPNVEVLSYMIDEKPEFNSKDTQGRKPVHYAACCSSADNIKLLIKHGVDTRDIDLFKKTPLMYACEAGRHEVVEVLLGPNRSQPDAKDKYSYCAIHYAAKNGHIECIKKLVANGVDINRTGPSNKTSLLIAAESNDIEMTKFLLQNGAKQTAKDKFGRTALITAVMNGSYEVASILLRNGAAFDVPDKSGNHPLHYACAYGYPEMIELLMEASCDPNLANDWKLNATTVALLKNYFECVKKILDYPQTDVNCVDNDGRSLISNTVKSITEQSYQNFIFLLEEKSADPNCQDQYGLSTLHHLCRITPAKVRNDNYPDYNQKQKSEKDKIDKTCTDLYKKFMKSIIEHNADVNLPNKDGIPPIFIALINKNTIAARYLLENPTIDLSLKTKEGDSIFHYLSNIALEDDFINIFQLIMDLCSERASLINYVNKAGFSSLHHLVDGIAKQYAAAKDSYIEHARNEMIESKQEEVHTKATLANEKSHKKVPAKKSSKFEGLKGGARTKQTARMNFWAEPRHA